MLERWVVGEASKAAGVGAACCSPPLLLAQVGVGTSASKAHAHHSADDHVAATPGRNVHFVARWWRQQVVQAATTSLSAPAGALKPISTRHIAFTQP
jgi:hypothetical protein